MESLAVFKSRLRTNLFVTHLSMSAGLGLPGTQKELWDRSAIATEGGYNNSASEFPIRPLQKSNLPGFVEPWCLPWNQSVFAPRNAKGYRIHEAMKRYTVILNSTNKIAEHYRIPGLIEALPALAP
ncbi:hypothetical protein NFI96_002287 [Prochilodus magdalenae]|nr:hypothetical protein NFI96_002287 [Prochilodus magdalenae]